jgi:HemY protein
MMKWLSSLLGVIAAGVGFTLFSRDDPGFIVISRGHWTVETSLSLFILGLAVTILGTYLLLNFVAWLWYLPRNLQARHLAKQQQKSHQMLQAAMLALWRKQWQSAEQHFLKSISHSAIPALHYLGAAYATLQLPPTPETQVRVADYFDHARHSLAIGEEILWLLQAQAQQTVNPRAALHNVLKAYTIAPQHPEILSLLITLYQRLSEWENVIALLPKIRQYNVLTSETIALLEIQAHAQLFAQISHQNAAATTHYWTQLPKSLRLQPALVLVYTQYLVAEGDAGRAEIVLRETLQQQWNKELINAYGQLRTIKPAEQIHHAETWLKTHFNDAGLLLALGRLCLREKSWDKAESYLKSALNQTPANQPVNPVIYQTLGEVLDYRGEASMPLS